MSPFDRKENWASERASVLFSVLQFCPVSFSSYLVCLTPTFVSFQLSLIAFQGKGESPWQRERMYLGFPISAERLLKGVVWAAKSQGTQKPKEKWGVLLSSIGVDGGANPGYCVMVGSIAVVCQAATGKSKKKKTWVIKAHFMAIVACAMQIAGDRAWSVWLPYGKDGCHQLCCSQAESWPWLLHPLEAVL